MSQWAKAPMDRKQVLLFFPTLDDSISQDHPVRLYDEILASCDWSLWQSQYVLVAGQPPIHPRVVASAILYGLSQGIRSSRSLERMCKNSLDYIWLVNGHHIDHTIFCKFRTRFSDQLKGLFRQIGRMALQMGFACLETVGLDGSRVRANSSRYGTSSAETTSKQLQQLDEQIERIMAEADEKDARLFGDHSPNKLPSELASLSKRQEKLHKALQAIQKKQSADTNFGSGENLAELQERQVEPYIPVRRNADRKENPAQRADPTQAVTEQDWAKLPRNVKTKKLDRSAFIYDSKADCYYCPMGNKLQFVGMQTKPRKNGPAEYRIYRGQGCSACALSGQCLTGGAVSRTICRDKYEPLREQMDARMNSPMGQKIYQQRKWLAETPFAIIKACMRFRPRLDRGVASRRSEPSGCGPVLVLI